MKKINDILRNVSKNKYTIKNNATIVDTDRGTLVFKKKGEQDVLNIYEYLKSRNFEYYPKIIDCCDDYYVYEYIDGIRVSNDEKAFDMMHLLSLLHNKTTYYVEIDMDEYKKIYEDLVSKIEDVNSYYNNTISIIEKKVYMSPSEYLIARNISKIYAALNYARNEIDNWYELMKNKQKKRTVVLYNNTDIEHLLVNKDRYLINWDKSKRDIPIYDFYNFYKKYALEFDFNDLLKYYEKNYPLLEEEKKLLFVMVSIPEKIEFSDSEINNCKNAKDIIDYIYKTETLIFPMENVNTVNE